MIEREQLDRLVDGELDETALKEVVQRCESDPALWRDVAIRFVEDQQLRAGLIGFAAEFDTPPGAVRHPGGIPIKRPEQGGFLFWPALSLLAASLLVGLFGGFLLGRNGYSPIASNGISESSIASASESAQEQNPDPGEHGLVNQVPPSTLVQYHRPDYHIQLQDSAGNSVLGSEIPLYSSQTAREIGYRMDDRQPVPSQLVQQLRDSGYELADRTRFISGRLSDGRRFVLPVRTISVYPGQ